MHECVCASSLSLSLSASLCLCVSVSVSLSLWPWHVRLCLSISLSPFNFYITSHHIASHWMLSEPHVRYARIAGSTILSLLAREQTRRLSKFAISLWRQSWVTLCWVSPNEQNKHIITTTIYTYIYIYIYLHIHIHAHKHILPGFTRGPRHPLHRRRASGASEHAEEVGREEVKAAVGRELYHIM